MDERKDEWVEKGKMDDMVGVWKEGMNNVSKRKKKMSVWKEGIKERNINKGRDG